VQQARGSTSAAAVRTAFGVVPGAVVGPSVPDVCTGAIDVPVPLRGAPGDYAAGKLALVSRASLYDGSSDVDKLKLTCVPPP
jgi:hypothetical protein